jgi:hypothetical protein
MFEDAWRVFAELHTTISRVGYKCVPARKGVVIDTHNFNGKALSTKYSAACSCTIEVGGRLQRLVFTGIGVVLCHPRLSETKR